MSKEQLTTQFLEHIVTLSHSERCAFITQLRRNTQIAGQCYNWRGCCVFGAFLLSKGINEESYEGIPGIMEKLQLKQSSPNYRWPAMTVLNDTYNVTFPEFIALIKSTMKRRYFVCAMTETGQFTTDYKVTVPWSYIWHPGTGTMVYCHHLNGEDTVYPFVHSIELCVKKYQEVTQSQAHAFHKRCRRRAKK